jgi:hypothetical protein
MLEHREYMPPRWQRMTTHRLTLVKEERPTQVGMAAPSVSTFVARATHLQHRAG